MFAPDDPSKPSNPHAIVQSLLKPCYDALFSATTIERPVALTAAVEITAPQNRKVKKESGRSEGGGGREPRPRLHSRRPAFADRPSCLQSKNNSMPGYEHVLRSCERHGYLEEVGMVLVLSA
jgi:hypothetical protein